MEDWREKVDALESIEHDPIQPQHLMQLIDRLRRRRDPVLGLGNDRNMGGSAHFDIRGDRARFISQGISRRWRLVAAVRDRQPDRLPPPVRAFVGDGGPATLMAEFATACRYGLPGRWSSTTTACSVRSCGNSSCSATPNSGSDSRTGSTSRRGRRLAEDSESVSTSATNSRMRSTRAPSPPGSRNRRRLSQPRRTPDARKGHLRAGEGIREAPFLAGQLRAPTIASTLFGTSSPELQA